MAYLVCFACRKSKNIVGLVLISYADEVHIRIDIPQIRSDVAGLVRRIVIRLARS